MKPIIIECEQYSPEWYEARRGKVSASRISDVLATTAKGAVAAGRKNYATELFLERLTGEVSDKSFSTPDMEWGKLHEPRAAALYEIQNSVTLHAVGLVLHPRIKHGCASPDRCVGDVGLVEIKCPNAATHWDFVDGGSIKGPYIKQMHWQMATTGRQWCDFVSFHPKFPAELQLWVQRVPRDPIVIAEIEAEVVTFLAEVEAKLTTARTKYLLNEVA